MDPQTELFSNKMLKEMIVPLFFEQLLVMLVGLADTLVVSYAGEAAVSGVSLVNQFNTVFIYLFTALASGGAVVISQYIGRKAPDDAGEAASQILMFSAVFSILVSVFVLIGNEGMLRLMFGKVEDDVMQVCIVYLKISAYSYPALAVYNAGAALFRSMGKTSVTMYLSVASNIINVIGNLIGESAVVLAFRGGPANGRHWNCCRNGQRLDDPGSYFLLEAEVRKVENISGDIIRMIKKNKQIYEDIIRNKKILVSYFSTSGVTAKLAWKLARLDCYRNFLITVEEKNELTGIYSISIIKPMDLLGKRMIFR